MPNQKQSRRTLTVIEGRDKNAPMVKGFALAAKKKGWGFCQLLGINSDRLARLDLEDIPLNFVIFREMSRNNYHEVERLMVWLKQNHKICINVDVAGRRISTSDKHFQQGLFLMDPFLKQYALPTYEAKSKANVLAYIRADRVHYPIVLKHRHGTAGEDITLITKESDLDSIKSFKNLLIEQYIKPECDFRVFVIGGVAVGTMRKMGDPDEPGNFKAWSAGREKHPETDPEVLATLCDIATRAASISRLEYVGVDIIREEKTGKYYILETNIAAGWTNNFIPTTHINIPELVVDWFAEIADHKEQPVAVATQSYLDKYKKYLPSSIKKACDEIIKGAPVDFKLFEEVFAKYPNRYIYDAGSIYNKLKETYLALLDSSEKPGNYQDLLTEIEHMPLSWAGNYIGPEVGTFHDGAILSALYLSLLHKTQKI